jgi:hypothetical protein
LEEVLIRRHAMVEREEDDDVEASLEARQPCGKLLDE